MPTHIADVQEPLRCRLFSSWDRRVSPLEEPSGSLGGLIFVNADNSANFLVKSKCLSSLTPTYILHSAQPQLLPPPTAASGVPVPLTFLRTSGLPKQCSWQFFWTFHPTPIFHLSFPPVFFLRKAQLKMFQHEGFGHLPIVKNEQKEER